MATAGKTISITRGDTAIYTVFARGPDGNRRPFVAGDILTMTMRKLPEKTSPILFQKVTKVFDLEGKAVFRIRQDDTANLEYGSYTYDVQYDSVDCEVTETIIKPGVYKITKEVT